MICWCAYYNDPYFFLFDTLRGHSDWRFRQLRFYHSRHHCSVQLQESSFEVVPEKAHAEVKRAVPPQVVEKGIELAGKALEKQLEIIAEQQKKVDEFVNKEVSRIPMQLINNASPLGCREAM